MSNASRGRAYYLGVNAACGDLGSFQLGMEGWFGEGIDATAPVRNVLAHSAANFYAETVDLEVRLGDLAHAEVLQDGTWIPGLCVRSTSTYRRRPPAGTAASITNAGGLSRWLPGTRSTAQERLLGQDSTMRRNEITTRR